MRILTLEDRGSVSLSMTDALQNEGHNVAEADTIGDAQEIWQAGDIDCLVVDLNMSPIGLRPEEIELTKDGILSGWIWLKRHVYPTCTEVRGIADTEMKKRTIIYSEYLDQLRKSASSEELRGISLIPKRGGDGAAELLKRVASITRLIEKE